MTKITDMVLPLSPLDVSFFNKKTSQIWVIMKRNIVCLFFWKERKAKYTSIRKQVSLVGGPGPALEKART